MVATASAILCLFIFGCMLIIFKIIDYRYRLAHRVRSECLLTPYWQYLPTNKEMAESWRFCTMWTMNSWRKWLEEEKRYKEKLNGNKD